MSWSNGFSGTKEQVTEQVKRAVKTNSYFPYSAVAPILAVLAAFPDDRYVTLATNGHADDERLGNITIQVSI